ncbi:MAG: hypothetical protein ACOXZV_04835 [Bacteroidales bacterium]|jgi:hypothetical protein
MRCYSLNIAGYRIKFESADGGPDLMASERFHRNFIEPNGNDVLIRVHRGYYKIPEEADRVFVAPYTIESKGIKYNKRDNFWSVYQHCTDLYIWTNFPDNGYGKRAVLKFSLLMREWDLWVEGAGDSVDPLEYPLDGLVLYYLTAINNDIMIHASGIHYDGQGYLFSGVSGRGKTTMAKLWNSIGGRIIHDDRLIIRNSGGEYRMYNTPVYHDDFPLDAPLNRIFLIGHGEMNEMQQIKGASAVSKVIANCIQHNYSQDMIARFLGSVSLMCSVIPVSKLSFMPDRRVVYFILKND